MDVFVTGGSGFVGGHLLRALTAAGHTARALVRSDAAAERVAAAGATPVRVALSARSELVAAMDGADAAVHAAALTEQWAPRAAFDEVTVAGTAAVVAAAGEAGLRTLVHVSTEAVLADGHPLVRVDESRPYPARPVGEYARSKGEAERIALASDSGDDGGLSVLAVRPRLVLGPGDTTVLPATLAAARAGRFAWIGDGRYLTSTCHVDNAVAGIVAALGSTGCGGRAYFLTDGETDAGTEGAPIEFRAFLTRLAATAGVDLGARTVPRPLAWAAATLAERVWTLARRPGEPPVTRTALALMGHEMTVVDTRARTELGYRPVIARDDGLAALA